MWSKMKAVRWAISILIVVVLSFVAWYSTLRYVELTEEVTFLRAENASRMFEIEVSYMDMHCQWVAQDKTPELPKKVEECLFVMGRLGGEPSFSARSQFLRECVDDAEHWHDLNRCRNQLKDADEACQERLDEIEGGVYERCIQAQEVLYDKKMSECRANLKACRTIISQGGDLR
jgi:hypothetical protein